MNIEINIYIVLAILFIHWVADFICQTDWQAQNKSKNETALLAHTITYSVIWIPMACAWFWHDFASIFLFVMITLVIHSTQDYFTSRINSKLYAQGKIYWFFVSIGFDQFLHFAQLLITYQLLK